EYGVVHVLTLRGDWVTDVDPTPPLGRIADLVVVRGELVIVDESFRHRIIHCNTMGNITRITPTPDDVQINDIAWDEGASALYVSLSQTANKQNSSIVRLERDGSVSARFVSWGSQWDGTQFMALVVGDWGLFAYDFNYQSIFVWKDHRR